MSAFKGLILVLVLPLIVASYRWDRRVKSSEFQQGRVLELTDFESGGLGPWLDESAAAAVWIIEDYGSPLDVTQPAPKPISGTKYLRVQRPAGTTGTAVLRSKPFTVSPGDQFRLSFWIRSQIIQTNNLEVIKITEQISGTSCKDFFFSTRL